MPAGFAPLPLLVRCGSQGREVDLNTDSRIPRVSERLVAAKSITLGAVPDRHCGGAGLRGRTLLESAGWTGLPGAGSCFRSVRGVQAGSV
jgi:hypothetical protein